MLIINASKKDVLCHYISYLKWVSHGFTKGSNTGLQGGHCQVHI